MFEKKEIVIFVGGCFWCMVKFFDEQLGIEKVVFGYIGGYIENFMYEEVCSEMIGYCEVV